MDLNQLQSTLEQLPLPDRVSILDALQDSIKAEYGLLSEQALQEDIYIAEQRLSVFDAGQDDSIPWCVVQQRVFGQ